MKALLIKKGVQYFRRLMFSFLSYYVLSLRRFMTTDILIWINLSFVLCFKKQFRFLIAYIISTISGNIFLRSPVSECKP